MRKIETADTEALLQSNERWCMNACNRYINRSADGGNVWLLKSWDGDIAALIVYSKQSLLPVLGALCAPGALRGGQEYIPPPYFLRGLFGTVPIHSLQGRKEDVLVMEAALEKVVLYAAENIDYDVMCIDRPPFDFYTPYTGLVLRKPRSDDIGALVALQAAYEQEEVLPTTAEFSAAVSRLNMERIFSKEQMLVAELNGRLIGKINTNAAAFARYQVGGVYVLPEYRGCGIARRMAGEFITSLIAQGKGISLFVKKTNPAARRVYQRIGFEILGDYRISYY